MKTLHPKYEINLFKNGFDFVVGADEVGRGSLAGPLISTALVFDKESILKIAKITRDPIRDSKTLSRFQRERLIPLIEKYAFQILIGSVSHRLIDQKGMGWASREVFYLPLAKCKSKKCLALIDAISLPKLKINHQSIIKGDSKIFSIALASIYAKVYRDNLMRQYAKKYPQYGFDRHVGYGTLIHRQAIQKYGTCQIHRQSFCKNIHTCAKY